jgi:hypothetical protein
MTCSGHAQFDRTCSVHRLRRQRGLRCVTPHRVGPVVGPLPRYSGGRHAVRLSEAGIPFRLGRALARGVQVRRPARHHT